MSIMAIIPARSGSKGIADKNIKQLGPIPLLAYSILVAKMVPKIDRIVVSTDSKKYAKIANHYGAETPFLRPAEISRDNSTDLDFFRHSLDWIASNGQDIPDILIHLRPTTPFRSHTVVQEAIDTFLDSKDATSLRSGHLAPESPFKWFLKDEEGFFMPLRNNLSSSEVNLPRQGFPEVYVPDGYIDIVRSHWIMNGCSLHGDKMLVFESPYCVEVDTPDDFFYLEYQLEREGSPILDYLENMKNS